jgi:hypothetical protein
MKNKTRSEQRNDTCMCGITHARSEWVKGGEFRSLQCESATLNHELHFTPRLLFNEAVPRAEVIQLQRGG